MIIFLILYELSIPIFCHAQENLEELVLTDKMVGTAGTVEPNKDQYFELRATKIIEINERKITYF